MTRRAKIIVAGCVQGVGFRAFTQKEAHRLGINGFVKNLPDGRVEIVAEADAEKLQDLLAWCHQGPLLARVDSVEVCEWDSQASLQGFAIIR